jgi:hypothetical protein
MAFLHDQDRKPTLGHERCQASLAGRPIGESSMRCRTAALAAMLAMAPGRRTRSGVGEGVLSPGGRGGPGAIATFQSETGKHSSSFNPHRMRRSNKPPGRARPGSPRFPVWHVYGELLRPMGLRGPARRPLGLDSAVREPVRSRRARLRHPVRRNLRSARSLPLLDIPRYLHIKIATFTSRIFRIRPS